MAVSTVTIYRHGAVLFICLLAVHACVAADTVTDEIRRRGETETADEVLKVSLRERWRIGGFSEKPGELFGSIVSLAVDRAGATYLVDSQQKEVKVFSPAGDFLGLLGDFGEGPGEHRNPWEVFVLPEGDVCVRQMNPMGFNVYDNRRVYTEQLQFDVGARSISGSKCGGGTIVVKAYYLGTRPGALTKTWKILTVQRDGSLQAEIARHERTYDTGHMIAHEVDARKNRFQVGPSGLVYLVPDYDYKIEVYDPNGDLLRVVTRPYERVERTDKGKELIRASYQQGGARYAEIEISDYAFDIRHFIVDDRARLWVRSSRGKGTQDGSIGIYDLFDAAGDFKRRIEFIGVDPGASSIWAINKWGVFVLGYGSEPDAEIETPERLICYDLPQILLD